MGDRGEQDPFEDLDQFFAPIEDDDWPEGEDAPASPSPPGYPAESDPADALAGLDELEIDLPDEGDLLAEPAAEAPGMPPAEAPPAPELPAEESGPPPGSPPSEPGAPPGQEWDLETSEMAGEEWDRLRAEALAADPGEEEAEAAGEQPISVDDLSGAPEQYADLPGPSEAPDEPSGPVLEDPLSGTGAGSADEGVFGVEEAPEAPVDAEAPAEETEPAEVEAAAEHFATAMRPEDVERELLSDLGDEPQPETVRIEPAAPVVTEEPAGDEGARPAEQPPPAAADGGRNLTAAMVSGGILGAAVLALLAIGKGPFLVLLVAAVLLAQAELYAVMRTRGFQPATLLGLVCGGVTLVGAYLQGEGALLLGPALAMGLTVPWYMAVSQPARRNLVANAAATMLGVMYVPFLASFAVLILRPGGDLGRNMFLVVIATTVIYDVCAYAVGTIWGNRPLAPTISPHKSWEGAIGATVVVTLVIPLITSNVEPFDFGRALGLGLLISILAPLGDLVESAVKRDFGVKDMSSLLPGHGGMLDRIDAILFVVPGAYFLLRIVLGG